MITPLSSNLLNSSANALQTAMQRLASGKRINSASDDPAGLEQLTALTTQSQASSQAVGNTIDVLALADSSDGALGQISDSLQRMRELAVQAANGAYGAGDIKSLQTQIDQLSQGLDQTAGSAQFNGQALLDGGFSATVQLGGNAGQDQTLTLPNATSTGLGVASLNLSTPAGAGQAISALDAALNQIGSAQATLGGTENALDASASAQQDSADSSAAAAGQLGDTDYAATATQFSQDKLHNQVALRAASLYASLQKSDTLALIGKT